MSKLPLICTEPGPTPRKTGVNGDQLCDQLMSAGIGQRHRTGGGKIALDRSTARHPGYRARMLCKSSSNYIMNNTELTTRAGVRRTPRGLVMLNDAEYFARRAGEERQAAFQAERMSIRLRHLEFAQAYELRVREILALRRRAQFEVVEALTRATAA